MGGFPERQAEYFLLSKNSRSIEEKAVFGVISNAKYAMHW